MGDEREIRFPDWAKSVDSGMSFHSCNKSGYHHRVKQLEAQLTASTERERVLVEALDKISHRAVPMTAQDDYRAGYWDAIQVCGNTARAALAQVKEE